MTTQFIASTKDKNAHLVHLEKFTLSVLPSYNIPYQARALRYTHAINSSFPKEVQLKVIAWCVYSRMVIVQMKLSLKFQPACGLLGILNSCLCFCNPVEVWTATFVLLRRKENHRAFFFKLFTAQMLLMKKFMFTLGLMAGKYLVCSEAERWLKP